MAIDTTNEKLALITFHQIWNTPAPISADGLGQGDKQQLIAEYPGILWTAEIPIGVISNPSIGSVSIGRDMDRSTISRTFGGSSTKRTSDPTSIVRSFGSKSTKRTIESAD